ncbi:MULTISPECIES: M16 family metallopeptidase [unclassified Neisseria]|uniref:M16 family metallopeptidase n=1 Tax=unclassified Neisseria TaxID=2623750 RepID=UPI001072720D|nr:MULTISPECIES: insulinase family protein [unclassified Neisseria]MBF0804088.1 insulinase family protein [Neisseria sp. 19428wB4_WF04]TFU43167.1 insulinase family protein [Neisseria sp. WF04]
MLLFPRLLLFAAAALSIAFARAAQTEYTAGTLDNGLAYHIFKVPSAERRLVLRLQINAGAADENEGEEGIAHITEHMVFQSSPAFPQGLGNRLNAEGWQMGRHYNAQTGYRHTRYMLTPPYGRRQLEQALAVYRQILTPQTFSPADWVKEQQVVLGEWRGQQTLPHRLNRQYHALLHSGSRSARYAPIGSKTAIETAQAATAGRFHNKWYGSNNAVLVVAGNINPKKAAAAIKENLGRLKPIALPEREAGEYEPKLTDTPRTEHIHDKDNTETKLSLVYRFHNTPSQSSGSQGYYHRLLDNFAAHIVNLRLQNTEPSVSFKLGNIGKQTGSLIFYADAATGAQEALNLLNNAVETIRLQPAGNEETAAYRKVLHNHMNTIPALPDNLPQIVQLADDTVLSDKPVPTPDNQTLERGQLYRISASAVNKRIAAWLTASDRLTVIQAPENTLDLAGKSSNPIAALQRKPDNRAAVPAAAATTARSTANTFPPHTGQGRIVSESFDSNNKVSYLQFSNGDKAVLLQKAVAGSKIYFKAVSEGGYRQNGLNEWQAQLAAGAVSHSSPADFGGRSLKQWQQQQGITYRYRLENDHQTTDIQAPKQTLEALLQLYRSRQTAPSAGPWQNVIETAALRHPVYLQSVPGRQEIELELLRYGRPESRAQNSSEIRALTETDLLQHWKQLSSAPTTYYVASSLPSEKIKPLLAQYLADIPRRAAENRPVELLKGSTLRRAAINDTGGTDINAWSWQPFYDWTPDTSEQIPLLVNLANARLKDALRSRNQNTYGVKFTARPQPVYNRVESNLFFSTRPEQAAEAWQTARQILESLPENISKTEADNLQQLFIEQEAKRQQNPEIWLERLAASHRRYGDARYLSRLPELHRTIIQTRLRQTAKLLWSSPNARVLLIDPAQ